ncbi:MAG: aminopeptidase [Candidatus Bathyarchaeota archaeon]|nr:MAG: aminopeptidase [Candidatus Bathyarchaeota archaeon]
MVAPLFVKEVVRTCLRIGKNDRVMIFTWRHTIDLAEALAKECTRAGARIHTELGTDEIFYDTVMNSEIKNLKTTNPFGLSLMDIATAGIFISGPEDPERLKSVPIERWNLISKADKPFYDRLFERKVRSAEILLGHVTPQRARTYGFNYENWQRNINEALDVKYEDMRARGMKLRSLLEKTQTVHITAANGTNLTFDLEDRPIYLHDGVVDEKDIESGLIFAELPSGVVQLAPSETSANGNFISNVPEPTTGVLIPHIRWDFKDGKIVTFEGGKNIDVAKEMWKEGTGDKNRMGRFTLGINPRAQTGFTYNPIVLGTVTIGVGDNTKIGGNNESDWGFQSTLAQPTVELDKKIVIKQGRLIQ